MTDSGIRGAKCAIMAACLSMAAMPAHAQQAHLRGEVGIQVVSMDHIVRVGRATNRANDVQVDLTNTDYHVNMDSDNAVLMVTY